MTPTKGKYAQIEKEALAFTWACERLSDYLIGMRFHIETDSAIGTIVQLKSSRRGPNQSAKIQIAHAVVSILDCTCGRQAFSNCNAFSHAPVSAPSTTDETLQHEAEIFINLVMEHLPATEQ